MMSISNTTPSISAAPPSCFFGSFSVNSITANVSNENTKLVLQPQALFQVPIASNASLAPSSTSSKATIEQVCQRYSYELH